MEKKILVPNSVPTQPGLENSKKNSKKFQKIKKHHSGIISILQLTATKGLNYYSSDYNDWNLLSSEQWFYHIHYFDVVNSFHTLVHTFWKLNKQN